MSDYCYTYGVEVLTIERDKHWRQTAAAPPCSLASGRTMTFFKGSLVWTRTIGLIPREGDLVLGFLRFSLEDESFSIVPAPPECPELRYSTCNLAEIRGELCLAHQIQPMDGPPAASQGWKAWIWTYDGADPLRWVLRHVIDAPSCIRLIAASDDDDSVVFQSGSCILECRGIEGVTSLASMDRLKYHHPDKDKLVDYTGEVVHGYDVIPYVPGMVPI
jgi:hypothetical protein